MSHQPDAGHTQNKKIRRALTPRDRYARFADDKRVLAFPSSCQLTLDRRAKAGFATALVLDGPGQVRLIPESGAELVNALGHDAMAGEGAAAMLLVPSNPDGQSAKYVLSGDTAPYNDTSPWTAQNAPVSGWYDAIWVGELELFVAVSSSAAVVMTSPDGATWTQHAAAGVIVAYSVCWSPELGLLAKVATDSVETSPDGSTWTDRSAPSGNWDSVCWSPELGLFCAISFTDNSAMTSPDGLVWTAHNLPASGIGNVGFEQVIWAPGPGLFVAVGDLGVPGFMIATSPDGINWTFRDEPANTGGLVSACWSEELGLIVAMADYGTGIFSVTSEDGIEWSGHAGTTSVPAHVVWAPELGLFIAAVYSGSDPRVAISPDGKAWEHVSDGAGNSSGWFGVAWSPPLGIAVLVGVSGATRAVSSNPL